MSAQVTISQLPTAGAITGSELVPVVQNGVTVQTTTGAISASPSQTQTFLTVNNEPTLPNSRYVGVTNGLVLTDGGAQGLFNISTTGALLSLNSSSTGFQVKTNGSTVVGRSITSSGAGVGITNGSGVAGNPVIALTGQIASLANLSVNGILTLDTSGTFAATQIQGTANEIDVANGTAISGYPTIGLADNPVIPGTGSMKVPVGSTVLQPIGSLGEMRFDSTTGNFVGYTSLGWQPFAAGSGVTSISTGLGLTGGTITSTGTISMLSTDITLGTTVASLGATVTTLGGLTSVAVTQNPTSALQLATKQYVDGLLVSYTAGTGLTLVGSQFSLTSPVLASLGGTGQTAYTVGDILYASTVTDLAKLADVAVGNALISGGVGVAPSYGKIGLTTHVSGTLPIASGGTNGTASPTAGGAIYGTGTAYAVTAAGTAGYVLTSAGASAPTWSGISGGTF